MDYILRDIDIELWSKVKAKATLIFLKYPRILNCP
jgi:hypothetical protein